MKSSYPQIIVASEREAGTDCTGCRQEILYGDQTATCKSCGAIHHEHCWWSQDGCRSYECSSGNTSGQSRGPILTVSRDELAATEPLPPPTNAFQEVDAADVRVPEKRWNRTAVWAFVIAILGIPLFGLVTGLIAIVVGCIALVLHSSNRKGAGLAVAGILIGLLDVVGWAIGLHHFLGENHSFVAFQELSAPDFDTLEELPEHLSRAMRANVVVKSSAGFARQGMGSGVILRIRDGLAWIVTNRHVIDHDYSDSTDSAPEDLSSLSDISIQTVGELMVSADIEWVAPHGVDLAIVSARLDPRDIVEAHWDIDAHPRIGDDVFAIGNPHGLGWTHSAGQLSQVRRRSHGVFPYRILQSTAALNPGNSGGGLYDQQGRLIGINTLTGDKRFAEGLGFSISLPTLLELLPQTFHLPDKNPETTEK